MDKGIGDVVNELHKQRLRENTIVIFLSDNDGRVKQIQKDQNQKWPSSKLGWKTPCPYDLALAFFNLPWYGEI